MKFEHKTIKEIELVVIPATDVLEAVTSLLLLAPTLVREADLRRMSAVDDSLVAADSLPPSTMVASR